MMVGDKKITYLSIDENGECHYHASKEEMEELREKLMSRKQEGVKTCYFETL